MPGGSCIDMAGGARSGRSPDRVMATALQSLRKVRRFIAGREDLPKGDFRDWDDVTTWAEQIAAELQPG